MLNSLKKERRLKKTKTAVNQKRSLLSKHPAAVSSVSVNDDFCISGELWDCDGGKSGPIRKGPVIVLHIRF